MRPVALSLLLLSTLALVGCQSKAEKVKKLQDQYNAEYPAYAKECLDETSGAARMLTGEKLTAEQMAALEAEEKRTRRTVQARGRPSCRDPETNSCRTAVTPYRCKKQRDHTNRKRKDKQ